MLNVTDRFVYIERSVICDADLHSFGQARADDRQGVVDCCRHVEWIRSRAFDDAERNCGLAVEAHYTPLVLRGNLRVANILKAHDVVVGSAQDQVVELGLGGEIGLRQH